MKAAPRTLRYTEDHEWASFDLNAGKTVRVGITEYAESQLGDIVYVDLPAVGTELRQHEAFGTVESVKSVSDLMSPVSGRVVAVNGALVDSPDAINKDAYGAGWIVEIEASETAELDALMNAEAYDAYVGGLG